MKTSITYLFLAPTLIPWLNLILASPATAQTFTTLKSFGIFTNISGFTPQCALVQGPEGTLYGTATYGESSVQGTVFKMQPDGSGFSVLKWFTNPLEGANPYRGLALSGSVLYGTTAYGGSSGYGTVFKVNTDGTGYTVLKNFTGGDGAHPAYAGLTLSDSVLYGATYYGGSSNAGTLFKLNTDGTGYTVLRSFDGYTSTNGAYPNTALTISGGVLYGTTEGGGSDVHGTVFAVNTDGTSFRSLHRFLGYPSDGSVVDGVLTLSGGLLYGTTYYGGSSGYGTVFKLNTDGTGYAVLKSLDYDNGGASPSGALVLSGGVLYGTATQGGSSSSGLVIQGTVFKVNTDGTGYTVLKNFAGNTLDGATPAAGLILSGGFLYGTAAQGGGSYAGTVFRVQPDGTGYTVLKNFGFSDGANPAAALTLSDSTFYGTTEYGGSAGNGAVFSIGTDGTDFKLLHSFAATDDYSGTNSDGHGPVGSLIVSGNSLYGTARIGGIEGVGTVFSLNTDGTEFTVLHSFSALSGPFPYTNSDGIFPYAGLALSGNSLYGTASEGGGGNSGTVFAVNTNGSRFRTLHSFAPSSDYVYTNSDGSFPFAGLILSGSTVYGTASDGTSSGNGTVFAVSRDGTGFTNLYSFTPSSGPFPFTNSDGVGPKGMILLGTTLYGTAAEGGSSGNGTVFAVNTDGTGLSNLHSFTALVSDTVSDTNSDGAVPHSGLIANLSGNTLYGTTTLGGSSGNGTVFAINTNGTGFTVLHSFTPLSALSNGGGTNSDGANPQGGLVLSGNSLYGTAPAGGALGEGTIFSLSFRPHLTIVPSGSNVILTWPASFAGFEYTGYRLQSTTNLNSPAAWVTNFPTPVVIAGQNTVTNSIATARRFYRLVQ